MTVQSTQRQATPVSVLICTRNRPQDIAFALPTVMAQEYPCYEVILVDQSTNEDTTRFVHERFGTDPRLRYIRTATVGLSVARNIALTEARHEICAFTDDDCEVPSDWLSNIVQTFTRYPETHVLFSPVHIPPDLMGREGLYFPCLYFKDDRVLRRGEIFGMGAMALRKSFWELVGPFDPLLGAGAPMPGSDEHDWLYRAHRANAVIRLEPKNAILHRSWRERSLWNRVARSYACGDAAFAMKHLRCGDLAMLPVILRGLFYIGARGVLRILQRDPGWRYEYNYVLGYWQGLWKSLSYRVDYRSRLFVAEPPASSSGLAAGTAPTVS
ncbi:MAG: glycosyltransferase family 2 protein [Chloroherpetonaceae bacterium]|nr:glycosyltransferase family 2 protein [Chloroherpetonaceae bacterium]